MWLTDENAGHEIMISELTVSGFLLLLTVRNCLVDLCPFICFNWLSSHLQQTFEEAELKKTEGEEEEGKPDPLTQLVTTFTRGAMSERSGALEEDNLYMSYAEVMAKSCGEEEEEGDDEGGGEEEGGASIHVSR